MGLEAADLIKDEREVLRDHHYSLRLLTKKAVDVPSYLLHSLRCTLLVEASFVLALATALVSWWPLPLLCLCALLGTLAASLLVLVASVFAGKLHKRVWRRPMVYWSWWPIWTLVLCCLGSVLGGVLGQHLWRGCFRKYYELSELQTYRDVDPVLVPGAQLQDAGTVEFSATADLDRARGGCFVNGGHTYCVAPIVHGGQLPSGLANAPRTGAYDYFAVGVDCCSCPNQDFRCGEFRNPAAHGGTRSADFASRPFYRLAVEDWSATYRKVVDHPLFFDWTYEPSARLHGLWHRGTHLLVLATCAVVPISFLAAFLLGLCLQLLVAWSYASPLATPGPPPGYDRAWEKLLPEMRRQFLEERRQLLSLPVGPLPNYASARLLADGQRMVPAQLRVGASGPPLPPVQRPRPPAPAPEGGDGWPREAPPLRLLLRPSCGLGLGGPWLRAWQLPKQEPEPPSGPVVVW